MARGHRPVTDGVQMTLWDRGGEVSVFLHTSGDHIVIRYHPDKRGGEYPDVLPIDSERWERAVERAKRARAFL